MQRNHRTFAGAGAALAAATMVALSGAYTAPPATAGQNSAKAPTQTSASNGIVYNKSTAEDTRGLYGGGHRTPGRRRFVGKRYSASVRQHQRHARKARNRKAAR